MKRTRLMPNKSGGDLSAYSEKLLGIEAANLIAYWILGEKIGSVAVDQIDSPAQDAAYSGVTLGQTGIGDGNTAPFLDGANDHIDIFTTAFEAVFEGLEGSISIWCKVNSSAVWEDGASRRVITLFSDASNNILIRKNSVNNVVSWVYEAANTVNSQNKFSVSNTDWVHLAMTWSDSANEQIDYFNGSQEGSTKIPATWGGTGLQDAQAVLGSKNTTPEEIWHGYLAHVAVWDKVLSATQIASLAAV